MLPVTISLGLINFNLLINSFFGTLVSDQAPAAIDKAFRIYMLPQGIFSVAVATVVFPTLARFAARQRLRRPALDDGQRDAPDPAPAGPGGRGDPGPLGADDPARLPARRVRRRPDRDLVADALFWFAFSLPFNGLFLLLTRTFFSLQRPWVPTAISGANLAITAVAALALYAPFGVGGIVAATAIATAASVVAQSVILRGELGGLELPQLANTAIRVTIAAALLAGVSYLVWDVLDDALGRDTLAQIVSLGAALVAGAAVYFGAVFALRVPEADQILRLLRRV